MMVQTVSEGERGILLGGSLINLISWFHCEGSKEFVAHVSKILVQVYGRMGVKSGLPSKCS